MDDSVVIEIANQLGIAVDQARQFINEQLPQYAALQIVQDTITIVVMAIIGVLFTAFMIYVFRYHTRVYKEDSNTFTHHDDFASFWVLAICGVVYACGIAAFAIVLCIDIPAIVGWSQYPEAMLIEMALDATKG